MIKCLNIFSFFLWSLFATLFAQTDLSVGGLTMLSNEVSSGCDLSVNEDVSMVVFNGGGSFFFGNLELNYLLNGNLVTEVLVGVSIPPGISLNYTFLQQADLSAEGIYNFTYWINTAGDTNPLNDTLNNHVVFNDVTNIPGILGGDLFACGNELVDLELTGLSGNDFTWEQSLDSSNWINIGFFEAEQMSFIPSFQEVFVRVYFEGGLCPDSISNVVKVVRVSAPDFTFNSTSFCETDDTVFFTLATNLGEVDSIQYFFESVYQYSTLDDVNYFRPSNNLVDSIVFHGNNLACGPFQHGYPLSYIEMADAGAVGRLNICPNTQLDTMRAVNFIGDTYSWLLYDEDTVFQEEVMGQDFVEAGMFNGNSLVQFVANNQCGSDTSKYSEINWLDIADVLVVNDETILQGDSVLVDLFAPVLNTLVWENNHQANMLSPFSYWLSPFSDTAYPFTINYGTCTFADTINVFVILNEDFSDPGFIEIDDLLIPNGITPNGDGYNDAFEIPLLTLFKVDISIYNKYGQQIFKSEDHQNDVVWDGSYNGNVAQGAYFVILHFKEEGQVIKHTLNVFATP